METKIKALLLFVTLCYRFSVAENEALDIFGAGESEGIQFIFFIFLT